MIKFQDHIDALCTGAKLLGFPVEKFYNGDIVITRGYRNCRINYDGKNLSVKIVITSTIPYDIYNKKSDYLFDKVEILSAAEDFVYK